MKFWICSFQIVALVRSMKKFDLRSSFKDRRKLRNGKILTLKKNPILKKKSILKTKNDIGPCIKRTSSDLNSFNIGNKTNCDTMTSSKKYEHLINNRRQLYIVLTRIPSALENRTSIEDQNNSSKYCYTNLENYVRLNEVHIYNKLEPKIENKSNSITRKSKRTIIPSKPLKKKDDLKTKLTNDLSVTYETNSDVRITRRKTVMLQTEERKQLDQVMLDKFPNNKFNMIGVKLNDISKEVKFLRTLGLICRFKCPLSTSNIKKKT